jgi:hypothetical protein
VNPLSKSAVGVEWVWLQILKEISFERSEAMSLLEFFYEKASIDREDCVNYRKSKAFVKIIGD